MKILTIAALAAAQLSLTAQPAFAADLGDEKGMNVASRHGAFAGARLRVPLDGAGPRKTRASLAVAPIVQGRQADGRTVTRFGEGMELRLGEARPQLALAGRPLSRIAEGRAGPDGRKAGISTIGWVAIGVGVAALTVFVLFESCKNGDICGSDNDG